MVGRGGRSKGCLTCRKRHVKCDGARPTCLRCEQSGFGCDGYKATEFINETDRFQRHQRSSASAVAKRSQLDEHWQWSGGTASSSSSSLVPVTRGTFSGLGLQQPRLWPMRDGICLSYLRNTLFEVDPRDRLPPWVGFRAADDDAGWRLPLSLQCLQALAKAYLGQVQGAPAVSREGSRLYVASLARLNRELRSLRAPPPPPPPPPPSDQEPAVRRSKNRTKSESESESQSPSTCETGDDDNVLAILILGAYEMFVLSSSTGWIDHALGLGSVLEMRGPHAFVASANNSLAHTLLESSRFLIILASLAVSKRTFLSRDEWKTIPWWWWSSSNGKSPDGPQASKSAADLLLDIFADLPGLMEQRERERERARKRKQGRGHERRCDEAEDLYDLRTKASKVLNDLLAWRRVWDSSPEGQITTKDSAAVLSSRRAASPSQFFDSTVLSFTSTHAATYTCLYDAALILAIELFLTSTTPGVSQAFPPPPTPPSSSSSSSRLFEEKEEDDDARMRSLSRTAAVEICRSIPFQLSRTSSLTGQFLVLYPLRMAWKALGGMRAGGTTTTTEARWVQDLLDEFGKDPRNQWGVLRQTITHGITSPSPA